METLLWGASHNVEHLYYVLCATFIVGGLVALFFTTESLRKGIMNTWISSIFLAIIGITLLYYGFTSLLDFYNGNHHTLDGFLQNVDKITRFF